LRTRVHAGLLLLALLASTALGLAGRGSEPASAAAVSGSANQLDTFVRGTDNALWHKQWTGTAWTVWQSLGGQLTSEPAAVASAGGHIDVFVRGSDFALWQRSFDGAQWGVWRSLGDRVASAPAVTSSSPGRFDLFAVAADGSLNYKSSTDNGVSWSSWTKLGGRLTSDPSAISWSAGRIDVVGRGTDHAVWHQWFDGAWHRWESLGGVAASGIGMASWGLGRLDLFVAGTDSALWHRWWDGSSWSVWQKLGGTLSSSPFATSWATGRIDAFGRGNDGAMWHLWWDGHRWSVWESQGGQIVSGTDAITLQVPVYRQAMNLDCETAALQMALAYYGHYYSQSDLFSLENPDTRPPVASNGLIHQWGDPYTNFVGNVNGTDRFPPTGYGIYYGRRRLVRGRHLQRGCQRTSRSRVGRGGLVPARGALLDGLGRAEYPLHVGRAHGGAERRHDHIGSHQRPVAWDAVLGRQGHLRAVLGRLQQHGHRLRLARQVDSRITCLLSSGRLRA
jgi:hypothetical protein